MTKNVKFIEVRDKGTFIPAIAIPVSGDDDYLARRAGFGRQMIYLIALSTSKASYDPFGWDNRTMSIAHQVIERDWDTISDGDVVDVQFVIGETKTPKQSERVDHVC